MALPGYGVNLRSPKVDVHDFSMIPKASIPRSKFSMSWTHKTTFSASLLIPIYCEEVLPGDSFNMQMSAFVRTATPLYPIMDNMDLETFFFFVPNRLTWVNWIYFMGEQETPSSSIAFAIPQIVSPVNGFPQLGIYDYFGLPTVGQTVAGNTVSVSALPFRAYNLIYNQWFKDQNLSSSLVFGASAASTYYAGMDNGPDLYTQYTLASPAKRHDYFTSCLPWTQKGLAGPVTLPLGTSAPVRTGSVVTSGTGQTPLGWWNTVSGLEVTGTSFTLGVTSSAPSATAVGTGALVSPSTVVPANLYADLSTATAATINAIRLAFQTQKLLERDARGGTRYPEIMRSHFGVVSPDARLMRPEYLGGGKTPVNIAPVPQTTATGVTGGATPLGTLAAVGTAVGRNNGFRQSFTEHGYIIGLACVRREQQYQQGIRRHWKRSTRYDYYFPVFSHLGEKSVFNYEIYSDGSANDALVFGYQEQWAEYRIVPSYTSAYFRSTTTTPLDAWHLATKFTALPTLNNTFITDDTNVVVQRAIAAGAQGNNQQFLCDLFFSQKVARLLPMYSDPGLVDHF